MQLPGIAQQKIMVAGYLEFLRQSCKTGIEAAELIEKVKIMRHAFRSARTLDQKDFWNNANETIEKLAEDGSPLNCKLMMQALMYDLGCHLDYLNLKFPDKV